MLPIGGASHPNGRSAANKDAVLALDGLLAHWRSSDVPPHSWVRRREVEALAQLVGSSPHTWQNRDPASFPLSPRLQLTSLVSLLHQ